MDQFRKIFFLIVFIYFYSGILASESDKKDEQFLEPSVFIDQYDELTNKLKDLNFAEDNDPYDGNIPDKPFQIVRPDSKHKGLEIVEENMKYLHRLNGTVMTVAVVGKFHTGKSFLMNQLMQKSDGFDIGSKVTPETMGIWIWGKPHQTDSNNKKWILFLDTEGFAAKDVLESYDAKIFAVSSLLSSKLIYNSLKIIDQSDIDYLELLARRTQLFAHKSKMLPNKGGGKDLYMEDDLLKFPHLLWVVQDFVQDTENEGCKSWFMGLLNTHTREEENYSISLKDIFPSVDCHTLFIPSAEKNLLYDLSKATDEQLTLDYRNDRDKLLEKISTFPDSNHTKFYTGTQLVAVLRTLVNGANMGSMQNVPNRWDAFLESLKKSSVEDCFKFYVSYIEMDADILKGEPKPPSHLEELSKLAQDKAFDLLRHFLQGLDKSLHESTTDLEELIEKHRVKMTNDNNNKINLKIISLSQEIEKEIFEKFQSIKLPTLSKEITNFYKNNMKEFTTNFTNKLQHLVSIRSLQPSIDKIQKIMKLNHDSVMLSNHEKLEKFFNQIITKLTEQAFNQVKIDSHQPMIPERCSALLNDLMSLTFQQFSKKTEQFHDEKSIYDIMLMKLKSLLNDEAALIMNDNEQAINFYLRKESTRLVAEYDDFVTKYTPDFPIDPETLNQNLEHDSLRMKNVFSSDLSSYSSSPYFMENYSKFIVEIDRITEGYQQKNFQAYRKAVDEPLKLSKQIIFLSAKQYRTQFSFLKFAKTICQLHLNDGKAKDWSPQLKERVINLFIAEDEDLKQEYESRAGFFSSIVGFFQWIFSFFFG